jgi:hypothetical protein
VSVTDTTFGFLREVGIMGVMFLKTVEGYENSETPFW